MLVWLSVCLCVCLNLFASKNKLRKIHQVNKDGRNECIRLLSFNMCSCVGVLVCMSIGKNNQ